MKLFRDAMSVCSVAMAALAMSLAMLAGGGTSLAQVSIGISVNFAPPELPVYEQPICPGEGYIWTPGYWAWDPDYADYYWVPGTWVPAPQPGYLWTPPYWGWSGVAFVFHEGYWGPRVGFYGGVNYGYGYTGRGYYGGRWDRGHFYYNRTVNNINVTQIHNVYNQTVVNNVNVTRVSYNGGNGGTRERATREEESAARERHLGAVGTQQQHIQEARTDRALRASDNHGKPPIAATDRPGQFRGGNVVAAKEGRYNPPPNRGGNNGNRPDNANRQPEANRSGATSRPESPDARTDRPPNARGAENNANRPTYVHPNDIPKANRPDRPPSTGNAKRDQGYQQQQDKMYQKQDQERQNLQKKQDQQHAKAEQQRANDAQRQQMEKQHQQQTQKMEQQQQQQQQKMQQKQQPKPQAQPKQQPPKQQEQPPHDKKP
jgi:hypothetical protein